MGFAIYLLLTFSAHRNTPHTRERQRQRQRENDLVLDLTFLLPVCDFLDIWLLGLLCFSSSSFLLEHDCLSDARFIIVMYFWLAGLRFFLFWEMQTCVVFESERRMLKSPGPAPS